MAYFFRIWLIFETKMAYFTPRALATLLAASLLAQSIESSPL
jgi:hypothetical protein